MPLLSPTQLDLVKKAVNPKSRKNEADFSGLLEEKGLDPASILERIEFEMQNGELSSNRVRAAEIALKLNGLLQKDDQVGNQVSVNIVIQDSQFGQVNPILIPR